MPMRMLTCMGGVRVRRAVSSTEASSLVETLLRLARRAEVADCSDSSTTSASADLEIRKRASLLTCGETVERRHTR